MNDRLVELPAPVLNEAAFERRREHLLAELQRPAAAHRLRPVALVLAAVVLGVLAFAPISGASLGHRLVTGLGDLWSTPAPPSKHPADVQNMAHDMTNLPPGITNRAGTPLPKDARDLATDLGTDNDTITAFPTSKGAVCYMILGAGSCADLKTWPWNTVGFTFSIFSTRAGGARVFGIASEKVASVSVVIGGVPHATILENHALYYQLPPGAHQSEIQRIGATWKDGSTHAVPVDTHWNPPGRG